MTRRGRAAVVVGVAALAFSAFAQPAPVSSSEAARRAILPPELPWHGKSLALVASPLDPWITPAEQAGFERTPSYEETLAYLRRLAAAAPELHLVSLGKSPEGRDIWMVVASKERARTPQALLLNGKPTLLAQAGIHAGEIDGKDAGLMLLRDLTVRGTRRALLERANLLFVPILSVDGHERNSPFSRLNQRGPRESGWRTNGRNQNLNRDYGKLDTPEVRAVVRALSEWQPDLYFDLHVTDGMDYQYDVTYGWNGAHGHSPAIAAWLESRLGPALVHDLEAMGHIPGPLIQPLDNDRPEQGLAGWTADTRFSNGYGDARHLATVLFENHSLKPYRQRVLGLHVALESALRALGESGAELRAATQADRARRPSEIVLSWRTPERPDATLEIRGVGMRRERSEVSGAERVVWTGVPQQQRYPLLRMNVKGATVSAPAAYWVPPAWSEVIERLALHGVRLEPLVASHADALREAVRDGELWNLWFTVVPEPSERCTTVIFAAGRDGGRRAPP